MGSTIVVVGDGPGQAQAIECRELTNQYPAVLQKVGEGATRSIFTSDVPIDLKRGTRFRVLAEERCSDGTGIFVVTLKRL